MAAFLITLIRPEAYLHTECLREVAETLQCGLWALGHDAEIAENRFDPSKVNILLGAHLLTAELASRMPPESILYNLEQLGGAELPALFYETAAKHLVWDYSPVNMARWQQLPLAWAPRLVEIGYVPQLTRIRSAAVVDQDIDVLFYGSLNTRRLHILDQLRAAGLRVHQAFGVYGTERDALIRRARLVLNVHYYETQLFEIVRVSYLLANGKAVVTEHSPDLGGLEKGVLACRYGDLVEQTVALAADDARREALAAQGAALFAARDEVQILRRALAMAPERRRITTTSTDGTTVPRRLNLGSGKDWQADCLNVDINDYWKPDAVLDISQPGAMGAKLSTARFGTLSLSPSCFDEILANDVLEHIPNLMQAMSTALELLSIGGVFNIHVPYDLSLGAWQDPTHVRAFNERSWLYYTEWFWYMGWTEARFTIDSLEFLLSPEGKRLQGERSGEEIVRTPRAVESMRVHLRKQLLTPKERQYVAEYLKRPERVAQMELAPV